MSVAVRNSIYIIVFTLFFSCKNTSRLRIETNSLNPNFIGELIDTLPVKKGDTILFRNWESNADTVFISGSNGKEYQLRNEPLVQYFKTRREKFNTNKIFIESNKNTTTLENFIVLDEMWEAYDFMQPPSINRIIKKSDSMGQMEFIYNNGAQFLINFKIKNSALHIIKMSDSMTYRGEEFNYNLDTLIVYNNKNRLIKSDELNKILKQKKNRVYSEKAVVKLTDTKEGYSVLIKSQTNDTVIVNFLDLLYPKNSLEIRGDNNNSLIYLPNPNVRANPPHSYSDIKDWDESIKPFDKIGISIPQSALHRDNIKIPNTITDERFKIRVMGYYKVNGKEIKVYSDWIYVDRSFFD